MLTDRFPLSSAIIKRRLRPIDMCVHKPDRVLLLLSCCFLLAFFGVRFFAVFFRYVEKYRMYMSNIAVLHTTILMTYFSSLLRRQHKCIVVPIYSMMLTIHQPTTVIASGTKQMWYLTVPVSETKKLAKLCSSFRSLIYQ